MLVNYLRGMKRKAHGTQKPRHIQKYVEVASTAQRSDSPAQIINQRFLKKEMGGIFPPISFLMPYMRKLLVRR